MAEGGSAVPFIVLEDGEAGSGKFRIDSQAEQLLQSWDEPIIIVAVAGEKAALWCTVAERPRHVLSPPRCLQDGEVFPFELPVRECSCRWSPRSWISSRVYSASLHKGHLDAPHSA